MLVNEPDPGSVQPAVHVEDMDPSAVQQNQESQPMNTDMQDEEQPTQGQAPQEGDQEGAQSEGHSQDGEQVGEDQYAQQYQQYQSHCLVSFRAENSGNTSRLIALTIEPKLDEFGNPRPLNFRCPESEIICEVFTTTPKYVVHLTKLDPAVQEWGDFAWSCRVVEKPSAAAAQANNSGNGNYGGYADDGGYGGTGDYFGTGQDDFAGEAGGGADEKACPACTYANPSYSTACGVCGTALS
jgi:hypothetical protein